MILTSRLLRYRISNHGEEIWFNTLTGALDRLTLAETTAVEQSVAAGVSGPFPCGSPLERLAARGYLFPDRATETAALRTVAARHADAPTRGGRRTLILCPTYSCNLRCSYCFERNQERALPGLSMDERLAGKALAAFDQVRSENGGFDYSLGLFGGEPLLPGSAKVVAMTLAAAESASLPVSIVTNGVNVRPFMPVLKKSARSISSVQLTIDGPPAVHNRRRPAAGGSGTFPAVAEAADLLLKNGIRVVLRVNVDTENAEALPELARIAERRGWAGNSSCHISLAPVKNHLAAGGSGAGSGEPELLSALIDVYDRDPGCEALFGFSGFQSTAAIARMAQDGEAPAPRFSHCEADLGGYLIAGADGLLYACPEAIGQPELAVGSFSGGLVIQPEKQAIWADRDALCSSDCAGCDVLSLCGGGCAYSSLAGGGDSRQDCQRELKEAIGIFIRRRLARLAD